MISAETIRAALLDPASGLAITPLFHGSQIKGVGVDLRLGPDLIVTRQATEVVAFDPADVDALRARLRDYQDYVRRPLGSAFYLHPGQFALARTLEYLTLPDWLSGEAMGRSSWGRLGLVIATATLIQPRFRGTVTLELSNLGTTPIVLYVGLRIAQIVFYPVAGHETAVANYARR